MHKNFTASEIKMVVKNYRAVLMKHGKDMVDTVLEKGTGKNRNSL